MKLLITLIMTLILALAAGCAQIPVSSSGPQPEGPVVVEEPAVEQPAVEQPAVENANNSGGLSGEQFDQQLALAVENRDFDTLRALMGGSFSVVTWNSSLTVIPADEALEQLRSGPLGPGSAPAVIFGTDVPSLLNGADPLDLWGPVADPVRAVHVTGLGSLGMDEGVLVIARDADGQRYFHGILLPPDGYFHGDGISGDAGAVVNTDVEYVIAARDVNLRGGPGTIYPVMGQVFAGQTALVTGISADGGWWRVPCPTDQSAHCWVSADPNLTSPSPGLP
jgi:uncharacterized protein YgiM (DUF1202 family)